MNDCYFEKKDWRVCRKEVRLLGPESDRLPEVFIHLSNVQVKDIASKLIHKVVTIDGGLSRMLEKARK